MQGIKRAGWPRIGGGGKLEGVGRGSGMVAAAQGDEEAAGGDRNGRKV